MSGDTPTKRHHLKRTTREPTLGALLASHLQRADLSKQVARMCAFLCSSLARQPRAPPHSGSHGHVLSSHRRSPHLSSKVGVR
eukprot:3565301-Pyramimonas_sp.AAC.1